MPSLKKGNKGVSVDAQERAADAKAKREKAMEKASKSGSAFEDQTVDYSKKPLDMTHVRRLSDLIGYCLFLGFIFCVVFLNPAEKNANNLISGMVQVLDPSKVTSVPAMWDFIDKLTPIIHADKYYNGAPLINSTVNGQYQSYWLNRENLALGRVRLRQIRLKPRMCSTAYAFEKYFKACNPPATWDSSSPKGVLIHDKSGPYGRYDGETPTDQLTGADHYQVNGDGYPWFSPDTKFLYPSEGFVATLPVDAPAATEEVARLVEVGWVDERTRAVFVEFSVYNANIDHFAVARFAFEMCDRPEPLLKLLKLLKQAVYFFHSLKKSIRLTSPGKVWPLVSPKGNHMQNLSRFLDCCISASPHPPIHPLFVFSSF